MVDGGESVGAVKGCVTPGNLAARAALSKTAGGRGNGAMAAGLDLVTPMSWRKVKVRPSVYLSTASCWDMRVGSMHTCLESPLAP